MRHHGWLWMVTKPVPASGGGGSGTTGRRTRFSVVTGRLPGAPETASGGGAPIGISTGSTTGASRAVSLCAGYCVTPTYAAPATSTADRTIGVMRRRGGDARAGVVESSDTEIERSIT